MKRIKLTQGKYVLVSDIDFEYLNQFKWHYNGGYAVRRILIEKLGKQRVQSMHRVVAERMGLDLSKTIDHKDRKKLNNQQENLRVATRSQQKINSSLWINNTSGYKGVSWDRGNQKWRARIKILGKNTHLGLFKTKEEAYKTYCKVAKKYHGEFFCG